MIKVGAPFRDTQSIPSPQEAVPNNPLALIRTISAAPELDALLPSIYPDILRLFHAEHALLYAVQREKRELYLKYASEPLRQPHALRVPATADNALGYCARKGKTLNIANAHNPAEWTAISAELCFDPTWDEQMGFPIRQLLIVPMLMAQKMMGVFMLVNKRSDEQFTQEEERLARRIAESLGLALQRQSQPHQPQAMIADTAPDAQLDMATLEQEALMSAELPENGLLRVFSSIAAPRSEPAQAHHSSNTFIEKITMARTLEEIFPAMAPDFLNLFEAEFAILYTVRRSTRELSARWVSTPCERPQALRVSIADDNPVGYAARRGRVLNIADAYDPAAWAALSPTIHFDPAWDEQSSTPTRQMLIVPVLVEYKTLMGLLLLINKRHSTGFTATEERLAQRIAVALGMAMQQQSMVAQERTVPCDEGEIESTLLSVLPTPSHDTQEIEMSSCLAVPRGSGKFDYLLEQQLVTPQEIEQATSEARRKGVDVETLLIEQYRVPKKAVGEALSRYYGCPFLEFDERTVVDRTLLKGMNLDYLKANYCLPLRRDGEIIEVLLDNPKDLIKVEHIHMLLRGHPVRWVVGLRKDILQCLASATGRQIELAGIENILGDLADASTASDEDVEVDSITINENDNAIVRLANQVIVDAYNRGASDIHIEPYATRQDTVIRIRIDGLCREYQRIPPSYRRALVSRLKVMARLDIAERRKPQDGKIKFRLPSGRDIELRVATIPTVSGDEDIVMRVLSASEPLSLPALQMTPHNLEAFQRLIHMPYGIVLVVGPTGSGKTTTLHAALGAINTPERKIWTAEDPVEITQYGLRQVQVHPRIGFTFAAAMRSFLRADPDVIMVGEMRDAETAHMGIEASLTGHLVFTTLHTNSAPETVTRLLDMGLDPFNFADALLGILAQRLTRTLCGQCKEAYHPERWQYEELRQAYGPEAFDALNLPYNEQFQLYRGAGCRACQGTGYRGRMGLHELLVGSEEIRRLIQERGRVTEIFACAQAEGMTTLLQDGVLKVLQGMTDFAQVKTVANK